MSSPFRAVEGPHHDEDEVWADSECRCADPDDQYLLEIDNGAVFLIHKTCGKQPSGDYTDLVEMGPIPVTVTAVPYGSCDGREWHGEYRCDCGIALVATVNRRFVPGGRLTFTRKQRTTDKETNPA